MAGFKINGTDASTDDWNLLCSSFENISKESLQIYTTDNELTKDEVIQILDSDKNGIITYHDINHTSAGRFQTMEGLLRKHGFKLSKEIYPILPGSLGDVSKHLWSNKEFVLAAVANRGTDLQYADESLKKDKEIVRLAISNDPEALKYADVSLKKDKEIVLLAIGQNNYQVLQYADDSIKKDKQFFLDLVRREWPVCLGLQYADASIKKDKDVILVAAMNCAATFEFADESLKKDRAFVLELVSRAGGALKFVDDSLKKDKEIVLAAVKNFGFAFQYADDSLKKDRAFVLEVVTASGFAFAYADVSLKKDKEIALVAVKDVGRELRNVDPLLKRDKDVVLAALNEDTSALEFVDPAVPGYREMVLEVLSKRVSEFQYVDESLVKDKNFIVDAAKVSIGILESDRIDPGDLEYAWNKLREENSGRLKVIFGNSDIRTYSGFKKALKEMFGIEFTERFRSFDTLLSVLELRKDPAAATGKTAVIISTKVDDAHSFETFPLIDKLKALGYNVIYCEAGNETDARKSLEDVTGNGKYKADLVVLSGHGTATSLALGQGADEGNTIDTSDFSDGHDDLALSMFIKEGGDMILDSCSNGAGGADNPDNLANSISNVLPGVRIQSTPIPTGLFDITAGVDGRPEAEFNGTQTYVTKNQARL